MGEFGVDDLIQGPGVVRQPSVIGAIRDTWIALGGEGSVLGKPLTNQLETHDRIGRFNQFEGGFIYWSPSTGAHATYGPIHDRWAELGKERSFLGYPISSSTDLPEGGKIGSFEHGTIYWWPDTGAIELNDVLVHYTGIVCFAETDNDQLSSSDEPYVVMGLVDPNMATAIRSQIYEGVNAGSSRPDLIEIYRGKPRGLALSVLLMEHDDGDPDKYKAAMQSAVGAAFTGVTALVALIPVVGPIIASITGPLLSAVSPTVGAELNRLLDTDDDRIGEFVFGLTLKDMVVLATRTMNSEERGVGFKLVTPLLTGHGAAYKVYFGLVPA